MKYVALILCVEGAGGYAPGTNSILVRPSAVAAVLQTVHPTECVRLVFSGGYTIAVVGTIESINRLLGDER